jgi:hypothetical protein
MEKKSKERTSARANIGSLLVYTAIVVLVIFLVTENSEKKPVPAITLPIATSTMAVGFPDITFPAEVKTSTIKKTAFPSPDGKSNLVEAVGTYPINTPFSERAEKHVKDFVDGFMKDYPEVNNITQSYEVSAEASVDVFHGKKLVSYLYNDWRDDGGAHGNSIFSSETFDMNGKKYNLADMFLSNADPLPILSRLATAHFIKNPDVNFDPKDSMFGGGLDTKLENFQTFVVSSNSLIFQFQNYQIGPYSDGAQRFEISVNDPEIKNIIRQELFGL